MERHLLTLEYDKIIEQLAGHAGFSASRELALNLRPAYEEEEVGRRLRETTEAKALLAKHGELGVGGARDVRPLVKRALLEAMLQPSELLEVRATLLSARALRQLVLRFEDECPLLAEKAAELRPLPEVSDEIGRCLDDEGRVLDSASPELARIRRESLHARDRLVERLRRIVMSGENARFLQEPIITERNGRYVIPLRTEFKGRIPGIIHDQSASGATLFIEPLEVVELSNYWRQLQLEERREIERILSELTRLVADDAEAITRDVELLAELDLALAKARYSFQIKGVPPVLSTARWPVAEPGTPLTPSEHPFNLIRARHPLLPAEQVVPIDVYMGGDFTVLLITGPNTGGKTVALKTIGLLAAMAQAGMHIPAADGSQLPVFSGIYADIGDEQSIEQSLSTFSSHMTHIVEILAHATAGSLVLLDELGAGTDPVEGAALAQVLISTLLERRCLTACSTHYSQLKVFAFNTPGVQNASVEFDVETLSPTYRLTIGLPGRSNALAIAKRLGLDEALIERARQLVSPEDLQADVLLTKVRAANEAAERARSMAEESLARAQKLEYELHKKLAELEQTRREILDQARAEGRAELERLRAEVRRIRSGLARPAEPSALPAPARAQEALVEIERLAEAVAPLPPVEEPAPPSTQKPRVGDRVLISTLGQSGELISLTDESAEVQVGSFRLRTRPTALQFLSRPVAAAGAEAAPLRRPQAASPGMELDMRGWRAEQVAPALDKYLDNAYLAGLPFVRIIHGKGLGVLKEVVRQFLAGHPLVASFRPGALEEGGEGVTVVQLRPLHD